MTDCMNVELYGFSMELSVKKSFGPKTSPKLDQTQEMHIVGIRLRCAFRTVSQPGVVVVLRSLKIPSSR